jgi:two-component sensor histidine kinase
LGHFLFSPTLKVLIATVLVLVISLLYHSSRGQFLDSESAIREGALALNQDTKLALQNRQELTRINKLWLQHIHGTVKSKVYAATLMIEKAETSQTSKIYNESLEKARVLLNSTVELPEYVNQSATSEIEFRISRWVGLVEIDLNIKIDDLDSRIYKPVAYADLIEEGITNAVRHGRCASIFIEIYENESGNLVTEVIDDGIYKPSTISGLGSALFESATNGRWSRTRDEELNRTTLRLLT